MKNSHTQQSYSDNIKNINKQTSTQNKKKRLFEFTRECKNKTYKQDDHAHGITSFNNSRHPFVFIKKVDAAFF